MRGSRRLVSLIAAIAFVTVSVAGSLTGCAVSASAGITGLPTGTKFDYQLGGDYTPPKGVGIVTRDSTGKPAAGLYNICYINGFQTQADAAAFWKKHPSLILTGSNGKPVEDPGWPGEMILDDSTAAKRKAIEAIEEPWISGCASNGFDAVEFDNLDSWTRSHGRLTKADNVALAILLVQAAHNYALAAGQKNTTQLGSAGKNTIHFDFAMAEECYRYNECSAYTKVYGSQVLDVEYTDDLRGTFAADCKSKDRPAMMILRDVDLSTPGTKGYVYKSC